MKHDGTGSDNRVMADLNPVDHAAAQSQEGPLSNLHVAACDRAWSQAHESSQAGIMIDTRLGIKQDAPAQHAARTNMGLGHHHDTRGQVGIVSYHGSGIHQSGKTGIRHLILKAGRHRLALDIVANGDQQVPNPVSPAKLRYIGLRSKNR